MKIVRHCHERLPGGTGAWQRLANKAGWDGTLYVYGYGCGNTRLDASQRRSFSQPPGTVKVYAGDFDTKTSDIRVWVPSQCGIKIRLAARPLQVFCHELGHFLAWEKYGQWIGEDEERAERIGRRLLKGI